LGAFGVRVKSFVESLNGIVVEFNAIGPCRFFMDVAALWPYGMGV